MPTAAEVKAKIIKIADKAAAKIEKLQKKLEALEEKSRRKAAAKLASEQTPEKPRAKKFGVKPVPEADSNKRSKKTGTKAKLVPGAIGKAPAKPKSGKSKAPKTA